MDVSCNINDRLHEEIYGLNLFIKRHSLFDAKIDCNNHDDCGMLYDQSCNGTEYYFCRNSAEKQVSSPGSCIYVKGKLSWFSLFAREINCYLI